MNRTDKLKQIRELVNDPASAKAKELPLVWVRIGDKYQAGNQVLTQAEFEKIQTRCPVIVFQKTQTEEVFK